MRVVLMSGVLLLGIGLGGGPGAAQEKVPPTEGDRNIYRWLVSQTQQLAERAFAGVHSRQEWERLRPKLREQFLDMLGLWPLPERTPLKATIIGVLERGPVRIEKLHFQSRPRLYVTANFYLPRNLPPGEKLPTVLYLCGHANRGRDGNKTAYQHHALWFATHGYACLVLDTLQLGEIAGVENCSLDYEQKWLNRLSYPHEAERMGEKARHLVPDGLALGTAREDAGSLGTDAHWDHPGQRAKGHFPGRGSLCPPVGPEQGEKSPGGHRA
jgi:hypothetical protein